MREGERIGRKRIKIDRKGKRERENKSRDEGKEREISRGVERRECRMPVLFYVHDMGLLLNGELEDDLRQMVGYFVEKCKGRDMKLTADTCKMKVLK